MSNWEYSLSNYEVSITDTLLTTLSRAEEAMGHTLERTRLYGQCVIYRCAVCGHSVFHSLTDDVCWGEALRVFCKKGTCDGNA